MQTQSEKRVTMTITLSAEAQQSTKLPSKTERQILSVPDNCSNCPESSCCPYASDRFHGSAGYDDV